MNIVGTGESIYSGDVIFYLSRNSSGWEIYTMENNKKMSTERFRDVYDAYNMAWRILKRASSGNHSKNEDE